MTKISIQYSWPEKPHNAQKRGSRKGKVNLQMVVPVWTLEGPEGKKDDVENSQNSALF